jgi:hypothetical protein
MTRIDFAGMIWTMFRRTKKYRPMRLFKIVAKNYLYGLKAMSMGKKPKQKKRAIDLQRIDEKDVDISTKQTLQSFQGAHAVFCCIRFD